MEKNHFIYIIAYEINLGLISCLVARLNYDVMDNIMG